MPTKHPRINVVVTDEQHALLQNLARSSNLTASKFLRLMLDDATPILRQAVPAVVSTSEWPVEFRQDDFKALIDEWETHGYFDQRSFPFGPMYRALGEQSRSDADLGRHSDNAV